MGAEFAAESQEGCRCWGGPESSHGDGETAGDSEQQEVVWHGAWCLASFSIILPIRLFVFPTTETTIRLRTKSRTGFTWKKQKLKTRKPAVLAYPIRPVLWRPRQEERHNCEARLRYLLRSCVREVKDGAQLVEYFSTVHGDLGRLPAPRTNSSDQENKISGLTQLGLRPSRSLGQRKNPWKVGSLKAMLKRWRNS